MHRLALSIFFANKSIIYRKSVFLNTYFYRKSVVFEVKIYRKSVVCVWYVAGF